MHACADLLAPVAASISALAVRRLSGERWMLALTLLTGATDLHPLAGFTWNQRSVFNVAIFLNSLSNIVREALLHTADKVEASSGVPWQGALA